MPQPRDMGPADLAPNTVPSETRTPDEAAKAERNAFYASLPIGAQERFLDALKSAADRGLSEDAAWEEAVLATQGRL